MPLRPQRLRLDALTSAVAPTAACGGDGGDEDEGAEAPATTELPADDVDAFNAGYAALSLIGVSPR